MIGEVVDEVGTRNDFIGHAGGDNFIVITTDDAALRIKQRVKERFAAEIQSHYNFIDRQQGFMQAPKADGGMEKVPFMTMSVGIVSPASSRSQIFERSRNSPPTPGGRIRKREWWKVPSNVTGMILASG